jgi:hypothetical protein
MMSPQAQRDVTGVPITLALSFTCYFIPYVALQPVLETPRNKHCPFVLNASGPENRSYWLWDLFESIEAYVVEGALSPVQYYLDSTQPSDVDAAWLLTALLEKLSLRQHRRHATL